MVGWLVDGSVGRSVCESVGQSVGWLIEEEAKKEEEKGGGAGGEYTTKVVTMNQHDAELKMYYITYICRYDLDRVLPLSTTYRHGIPDGEQESVIGHTLQVYTCSSPNCVSG